MSSDAQKRAKKNYIKSKVKRYVVDLYPTDADIIEHLEKQAVKQTYLKELIREDIARKSNKEG